MDVQKTHLSHELEVAGINAKYDAYAKRIFSDKSILARILNETTPEFRNYSPEKIISSIEETPQVSTIPIYPGKTAEAITGLPTESKIPNEGEVFFDILFYVVTPDDKHEKIIVDIEIQNKFNPGYDLTIRGDFYCSRIMSAQLGSEFNIPNYGDIKKVYSIWICFDCPADVQNTIVEFSSVKTEIFGHFTRTMRIKNSSVILVCLGKGDNTGKGTNLHRLLETIISKELSVHQKETILESEFGIRRKQDRKELLQNMCNLSEGIFQDGYNKGYQKGREEASTLSKGIFQDGYDKGYDEGLQKGVQKLILASAINLFRRGVALEVIAQSIPELTDDDLKNIQESAN